MIRAGLQLATMLVLMPATQVMAADRFFGFNNTTATVFTEVYLAPHGTTHWGPNQALNDKDKTWEPGERLLFKSVSRAMFDLRIVDRSGRTCVKPNIDLTKDTTFDVRDNDLHDCRP